MVRQRIVRWILPVIVFIAAWQIWDAVELRRFEGELGRVFPVTSAVPVPAAGSDAAAYYAAAAILQAGSDAIATAPGNDPAWLRRRALTGADDVPPAADLPADERRDAALRLLDEAAPRPYASIPAAGEFAFRRVGFRRLAQVAAVRTLDAAALADGDAAADSLVAQLGLLRVFRDGGLFESTVKGDEVAGVAADTSILLSRAAAGSSQLTRLERALADADEDDELIRVIRAEARFIADTVRPGRPMPRLWPGDFLIRPGLRHYVTTLLQISADALAVAGRPWPARVRDLQALPERRMRLPVAHVFFSPARVLNGYRDRAVSIGVSTTLLRAARLAVLVEQYRRVTGTLPDRLEEVPPATGARALDPFTGAPFLFRRDATGYAIYGVGPDGRDDGGRLAPAAVPAGQMRRTVRPPDIGIRVRVVS